MSKLLNAADTIERELNRLAGLRDAAEAFRRIGSLEQAEEDAKHRYADISAKVVEAEKRKTEAENLVPGAKKAADGIVNRAHEESAAIKAKATAEAEHIAEDAEERATQAIKVAEANAAEIVRNAMSSKDDFDERAKQSQQSVVMIRAEVEARKAELAELTGKITKARDEIKRMLGG